MLLEALRAYADEQMATDIPPAGYQPQTVRYIARLAADGVLRDVIDVSDTTTKRRGVTILAPYVKRASAIKPRLLADTAEYVFGIARAGSTTPDRVKSQRAAWLDVLDACAQATQEPTLQAVATFVRSPVEMSRLPAPFDPTAVMTFRVATEENANGILPVDLPSVRTWWAGYLNPDADENADNHGMQCIVCGNVGPVLKRHPLKIKGIPGGQVLKDLISGNAPAFTSYGLEASEIAPTCATCAEAYGNALNHLLASDHHRVWTKEAAYAFWVNAPTQQVTQIVIGAFQQPDAHADQVESLLKAYTSGGRDALSLDTTRFYAAAFGASGARVVVKDWIDTTAANALRTMQRYFALQDMVDAWTGAPGRPVPFFWLTGSTVHRKGTPSPIVGRSLVRLALAGDPLPMEILYLTIRRNRAEQSVTRERAMLIKMVLGSYYQLSPEEVSRMSQLDPKQDRPAYACGRLLATLDRIQSAALGSPNATIVDKFYGTASSAPATVFGTLMHGAQNHLGKLRNTRRGLYVTLEQELQDATAKLTSFPTTLSLEDQGLFALGFYHQRAEQRARAIAAKERRDAGKATDMDQDILETHDDLASE